MHDNGASISLVIVSFRKPKDWKIISHSGATWPGISKSGMQGLFSRSPAFLKESAVLKPARRNTGTPDPSRITVDSRPNKASSCSQGPVVQSSDKEGFFVLNYSTSVVKPRFSVFG